MGIRAVVPNHDGAVSLVRQYDFEFGDQFAIDIRHQWLLCWSNDSRGSSENNAEQRPPPTGEIARDSCPDATFLRIIATSGLAAKLKEDKREIFRAASEAQRIADYLLAFHLDYASEAESDRDTETSAPALAA
jgi:hypothetical protein